MKRMRIVGLCLVAVFALSAVVAASASAHAAFFECKAQAGGKYEKKCTKLQSGKGKGGYEVVEGAGNSKTKGLFKGKGGKATLHTPAVGGEITCTAFSDSGYTNTATTEDKVLSVFSGCSTAGKKCTSVQAKEKAGDITTFDLAGKLVDLSGGAVGVDLTPESGTELASFTCEGLVIHVTGSVYGELTPLEKFSKKNSTVFEVTGGGVQKYTEAEGVKDVLETELNGAGPFESGQEATAANSGEELEIKA